MQITHLTAWGRRVEDAAECHRGLEPSRSEAGLQNLLSGWLTQLANLTVFATAAVDLEQRRISWALRLYEK